jgi:tetratricopeptide (TPR) repeat protein
MAVSAESLNQQAALLIRQGRLEEAKAHLQQALQLKPNYAEAHANLGNVFIYQHRYDEAIDQYQQALRLDPNLFAVHYILAIALHDKGRFDQAEAHYRQALRLNPHHAAAHHSLGITLMAAHRLDEAVACYQQALRLDPQIADAYNNLANALAQQEKLAEAVSCYEQALRLNPDRKEIHFNLGISLERLEKPVEATRSYNAALRLDPNYAEAHMNLGNVLAQQGKTDDAIKCYEQVLKTKPGDAEALTNIGNVHRDQAHFDDALACFEHALRQNPQTAGPHHNRALLWLLLGKWTEGWPEYEWRWKTSDFTRLSFQQPRWDGSPLQGRSILLVAEQGLGDTVQFLRYVPLVEQRGGRVIVQCQPALKRLLQESAGIKNLIVQGAPLPKFDVYSPLLSLPGILKTSPSTVPADVPYIHPKTELVGQWRRNLSGVRRPVSSVKNTLSSDTGHRTPDSGLLRVGIAWQGSPAYRFDRQRSIPLKEFACLANVPGVQLISLQKGPGTEQVKSGVRSPVSGVKNPADSGHRTPDSGRFCFDLGDCFDEASGPFMDTAAVMESLDLVITSDTVIPHLAGALGIPVWVALPLIPDWRWLLQREDSPWYPTMRLFRQTRKGQWEDVFVRIAGQLAKVVLSGHRR